MERYSFEEFSFDPQTGTIFRAGVAHGLRPKTALVLAYMLQHQGRLLSKHELLQKLWSDVEVGDDSLTQCVSEIRAAIADDQRQLLKTIPKRGFIFNGNSSDSFRAMPSARGHRTKPLLAVLPFDDLNQDEHRGYISSGITEDIIVEISRLRELAVVARSSSFRFRNSDLDAREIGRALGAQYILDGSVRRQRGRLRLTANLVDVEHGAHVWAESFDRRLMDVFETQSELARTVGCHLVEHIARAEFEKSRSKPPSVWHAYDHYLNANENMYKYWATLNANSVYESRRLLERSIEDDPQYGRSYALLAHTYTTAAVNALDSDYLKPATLEKAEGLARKSISLDPGLAQARAYLGMILMFRRNFDHPCCSRARGSRSCAGACAARSSCRGRRRWPPCGRRG